MPTGEPREAWPQVFRLAHLGGGMRASNPPGASIEFLPRLPGTPRGFSLAQFNHLHAALMHGGLTLIGVDFISHRLEAIGAMPCDWRPHWPQRGYLAHDAETLWSQLATGAHDTDDYQLVDLCRRITFQIRAGSWRLHELSEAYHKELCGRIIDGEFKDGQKFESMNSFLIYLATHSFLTDMATLRDYLAEFMAKYVFMDFNAGRTHLRTLKGLRKNIIPSALGKHPLADVISNITDAGGWLKTLSTYRDLAVHYTPLASATRHPFLEQKLIKPSGGSAFPAIQFSLPGDPEAVQKMRDTGGMSASVREWLRESFAEGNVVAKGPDALEYSHQALGMMALLASEVGGFAPIKPKMAHFGPHNMIGPLTVRRG